MSPSCAPVDPIAVTLARLALLVTVTTGGIFACGCGRWRPETAPTQLPRPAMSPDTVVVEIAKIRLPYEQVDAQFWAAVDEQSLSLEIRQKLAGNGFRSGILAGELPASLRDAVAQGQVANRIGDLDPERTHGPVTSQQRLQNRTGRRGKLITSDIRDELVTLMPDAGRVTGKTLYMAQCLLSLRSYPRGDGHVRLELVPEIEHGEPRTRWLGQPADGTFRLDTGRERTIFNELRFDTVLAPGETLLVTSSSEWKGLGRQFFADSAGEIRMQRVLLIRLAQTQADDLLAPSPLMEAELPQDELQ
jgi:hypothetical protein